MKNGPYESIEFVSEKSISLMQLDNLNKSKLM